MPVITKQRAWAFLGIILLAIVGGAVVSTVSEGKSCESANHWHAEQAAYATGINSTNATFHHAKAQAYDNATGQCPEWEAWRQPQ